MDRTILYSAVICAAGAALEAVMAGRGVKRRFIELRLPRFSPPLWAWLIIGGFYYAICFAILYRLFHLPSSGLRSIAFALLLGLMLINAAWNYLFFRKRDLFLSLVAGAPYGAVALGLFCVLLQLEPPAAWWLLPYIVYLLYANAWGYRLWTLNSSPIQ